MARRFLTALDLSKNELQNAVVQNLGAAPSSPLAGQLYYDSAGNVLYWWDGTAWRSAAGAVPANTVTADSAFGAASAAGAATTYSRGDHTHGSPVHGPVEHTAIPLSYLASPIVDVPWGNVRLTSLGAPTASTDAANKQYVDNAVAGLAWKEPVRCATTTNLASLNGLLLVDGVTLVPNDRVLVKDQTTASANGIYVASSSAWTRATDADALGELDAAAVWVNSGTANGDKQFVCTTDPPITVGTTATTWVQFGGGAAYTAGAGLLANGNTFDVVAANGSLTVAADSIQVAYGGNGAAVTAARSDHNHDGTYAKKVAQDCAASTSTAVAHNLNTRDVLVNVFRTTTPWDSVETDVERTDANTVTVRFASAPTAGQYRIVVAA